MSLYDDSNDQHNEYRERWRAIGDEFNASRNVGTGSNAHDEGLAAMGRYHNNGKQVLFQQNEGEPNIHIADAGDNDKAHFLATAANWFSYTHPDGSHVHDAEDKTLPLFEQAGGVADEAVQAVEQRGRDAAAGVAAASDPLRRQSPNYRPG
jgi:hypothetical protein